MLSPVQVYKILKRGSKNVSFWIGLVYMLQAILVIFPLLLLRVFLSEHYGSEMLGWILYIAITVISLFCFWYLTGLGIIRYYNWYLPEENENEGR